MKTLKFVSYTVLVIFIIQFVLTVSIPFRFPGSSVAWNFVISSDILLAMVSALLFILPRLKKSILPGVVLGTALISITFTIFGWTPWIITVAFLVALLGMYLTFLRIRA